MKRDILVIGNWKATPDDSYEASSRISMLEASIPKKLESKMESRHDSLYKIAVPDIFISELLPLVKKGELGLQDISYNGTGAYTGQTTINMLKKSGATFALVGHSEMRGYGDTDEVVSRKALTLLSNNITCVLCVGEEGQKSESGDDNSTGTNNELTDQLKASLSLIEEHHLANLVIAYEPLFAIGGDMRADDDHIHESIKLIRSTLLDLYPLNQAKKVKILYGGSVDSANCRSIIDVAGADGVLVGRASQDPVAFYEILEELWK